LIYKNKQQKGALNAFKQEAENPVKDYSNVSS